MIVGLYFSLCYTGEKDCKIKQILQMLGAMKKL